MLRLLTGARNGTAGDGLHHQKAAIDQVEERLHGAAKRLSEYEQTAARLRSVEYRRDVISRDSD